MASTTFVDRRTPIMASWLNDVNNHVYNGKSLDNISVINVKDPTYGAVGDGVTDDSAAFITAQTALVNGGVLYIPDGTYLLSSSVALNSNVCLVGNGPTSILKGGVSSFITATSKSNIEIRSVKFLNDNYRVRFDLCTNVRLINCYADGTRATTNVTNQGFWFSGCDDVLIENPYFVDYRDAVYFDKNGSTACGTAIVRGGQIWQSKHGSSINFPTGVYGVDIKNLYVEGVTFKNIKASSDSVAEGTGYGVYEGDGTDGNLQMVKITNCKFIDDDGYTTRPMIGILTTITENSLVDSCYFKGPSGGSFVGFIYGAREQTIQNCVFDSAACQLNRQTGTPKIWSVFNNTFKNITGRVLRVGPDSPGPASVLILGNTFNNCTNGPITVVNATYTQVVGNTVYECNTSGLTSDSYRAGINFDGPTTGLVSNNTVINVSAGLCQYGFNVANVTNQVVVTQNNYFKGMTVAQTRNTLSAAPTTGTWGVGDFIWNWSPSAGGTPGWVCTTAGTSGTWKAMANIAA